MRWVGDITGMKAGGEMGGGYNRDGGWGEMGREYNRDGGWG